MSVTTYEIGCSYLHQKLKNKVYFISNNNAVISIDNGAASVSITGGITPNVIEGFGIKFTETESLDERYKFTKQLNISINGHLTDTTWLLENDFYIMIETIEGVFYLINVDFPSKMNFTYNLSNSQDQTDFVFTSNSNFPTLKVNSVPWESFDTCKTYHVPGVDYLKLLEKYYATIDKENGVVNLFNSQTFKNIDYLKNTISLQETYDGDIATTTISFEIPFDDYETSWQYNLLEFKQNLYVAEVGNVNGNAIFAGFEHGLEPQYEINASTSNGEATSIKITLTEASNWGIFEFDNWSYNNVTTKKWVGVDSEVKCIGLGYGINTLMMEVNENGSPTGRYKCLAGLENEYSNYNIIGTYTESDVESFRTSVCTRFRSRAGGGTGYYTCINGDKYEFIGDGVSYDGGKTWDYSNLELGPMVESGSSWCELPVQYKWELMDESTCLIEIEKWTPSGYTCVGYDKYQNNVKEISHDGGTTWENTGIESASTLIETDSPDCGYIPPIYRTETGTTCSGCDLYDVTYYQVSYDNGVTWNTISSETGSMIEVYSIECGCRPEDENFTIVPLENKGLTFKIKGFDYKYKPKYKLSSMNYFTDLSEDTWVSIPAGQKCEFINDGIGDVKIFGNLVIMDNYSSDRTNFAVRGNLSTLASDGGCRYQGFFEGLLGLVDAENLVLNGGFDVEYACMFSGCTNLILPPKSLPSTVDSGCCRFMFDSCSSLIKTPEFATKRANHQAYFNMFQGCTSLTYTMPIPDVIHTGYQIYELMFENCSNLTEIIMLDSQYGTENWVRGVSETGTFYKRNDTSWSLGESGIPSGWTIEDYHLGPCKCSYFRYSFNDITVPCTVTSVTFNYSGCTKPDLTSAETYDWLSVTSHNYNTGTSEGSVIINVLENTGLTRTANLYISLSGNGCSYICITQQPGIFKYKLIYNDETVISTDCDNTSAITSSDTSNKNALVCAIIGDCVSSIGNSTFNNCTNLTSCTIGNNVSSIGNSAFVGCNSLSSITIPNSVTDIGGWAFAYNSGFTNIVIPDTVTNIGSGIFRECSGLTTCVLGNGITSIPSSAFRYSKNIASISIPSGVTYISNWAFQGCSNLSSLIVNATTPPTMGSYVFQNVSSNLVIYVPSTSIEAYKSANDWAYLADKIQPIT